MGTPWLTTLGISAGQALAALMSEPRPAEGPYQAIFASIAKDSASRHNPQTKAVRRKAGQAAELLDIIAVYHAVATALLPDAPAAPQLPRSMVKTETAAKGQLQFA